MDGGAWCAAVHGVAKSRTRLSDFTFTFHFHALEKEMATHSSVLPWKVPGMGEPGGLLSMESHRVRHDWSDLAAAAAILLSKVRSHRQCHWADNCSNISSKLKRAQRERVPFVSHIKIFPRWRKKTQLSLQHVGTLWLERMQVGVEMSAADQSMFKLDGKMTRTLWFVVCCSNKDGNFSGWTKLKTISY